MTDIDEQNYHRWTARQVVDHEGSEIGKVWTSTWTS
jgi:hypothetical protein